MIPTHFQVEYIGQREFYEFNQYRWDEENGWVCVIEADDWDLMKRRKVLRLVEKNGTEAADPYA
jgi:hypothetical protein